MRAMWILGPVLLVGACSGDSLPATDGGDGPTGDGRTADGRVADGLRADAPRSDGPRGDGPSVDAASVDGPAPGDGSAPAVDGGAKPNQITFKGCLGIAPGTEDCHFRMLIDPATCSAQKRCDKLVIYWSGGEGGCAKGAYDKLLKMYTDRSYVAVCAQPFSSSAETGAYPYYKEFLRMDLLTKSIRADPDVQAAWTGDKLLIAGVSHGASAPLMAIASKAALKNNPAVWTGAKKTALVLYDGISNPASNEAFFGTTSGCGSWHQRFVRRYGDGTPLVHSCLNKKCYCSNPAHRAEWDKDNVQLGSPNTPYTCSDVTGQAGTTVLYRFVACSGGAAPPCGLLGDIIPVDQQQNAFDGIKGCAGAKATFQKKPVCPHTACGTALCGANETFAWLTSQGF